jgi:serine phosphatase RsbU (regulator of sigma subunit)
MAERLGTVAVQADTLATIGILQDRPDTAALSALEKAVELAEANGLLQIAVRAHHNLAGAKRQRGDVEASLQHFLRAAELARRRGSVQEEFYSLFSYVGAKLTQGELEEARQYIQKLEKIVDGLPDPVLLWLDMQILRGAFHGVLGEWHEALRLIAECVSRARERGDLQIMLNGLHEQVIFVLEIDSFGEKQDLSTSLELLEEARGLQERSFGKTGWGRSLYCRVLSRQGRHVEARQALEDAQANLDQGSPFEQVALLQAEAELASAEAHWAEARTAIEAGLNIETRLGQHWNQARWTLQLGEVYLAQGRPEDLLRAESLYRLAMEMFQQMGAAGYQRVAEARLKMASDMAQSHYLESQQVVQEMAQARKMQTAFLPEELPQLRGWDVSARLDSMRQTSGDFYDFIPLADGRLGIVIADVADKGAAAALFMASSRTLLRAYAGEYPDQPEKVMAIVNRRLLSDTRAGLFVTGVYAVLDPVSGLLVYCNAGHNPPCLFRARPGEVPQLLKSTGMSLGVLEEHEWLQAEIQIHTGDVLVLYTDGLTDEQSASGEYYGAQKLNELVASLLSSIESQPVSALQIQQSIIADLDGFLAGTPRQDDLTLIVLKRLANQ